MPKETAIKIVNDLCDTIKRTAPKGSQGTVLHNAINRAEEFCDLIIEELQTFSTPNSEIQKRIEFWKSVHKEMENL